MSDRLSITAIIITYKRPDEIDKAIANVLELNPLPDEIIVFDDDPQGSGYTDAIKNNHHIAYHCTEINSGPAGARNNAAQFAHGDILLFMDDDCRFATEVTKYVQELFADSSIAFLAFLIRNGYTGDILPKEYPGYHPEGWQLPHEVSYFCASGFAIRRNVFMDLGGFDRTLYYCEEELEISFRILGCGNKMYYSPDLLVSHYTSPEGRETLRRPYRLIRNRIYLAFKHLPFPFILSHLFIWSGFAFLQALRTKSLKEFFSGLSSVWQDGLIKQALAYRKKHPMRWETVKYLWKHEGRLWY